MAEKAPRKTSAAQNPAPAKRAQKNASAPSSQPDATDGAIQSDDAVELLKADHRAAEALFAQCQAESLSDEDKRELVEQVCETLSIHSTLEDEIFYPACREHGVDTALMNEAQVEHDCAALLIAQLMVAEPDAPYYDAKVKVLSEYIQMHVREEEKPSSGIFAKAKSAGLDMSALGQRLKSRKQELEAETQPVPPPTPRTLGIEDGDSNMASRNQDRDDQGRFVSDRSGSRYGGSSDDNRRSSRYGDDDGRSSSRSRYDDDDRGRYSGSSSSGRDDDRYGSSRGSDDRGRSHGGWFGDSEGHSRAAERGWSNRNDDRDDDRGRMSGRDDDRGGRSSSRDRDDDRGGRSSSRDRDDDRGGRSSSRDRDDDRDRGQGGWFGDSRGHSMAAQRGWDSRRDDDSRGSSRSRYDDDNRSSSRSRDDDDDRGSSRDRGQGGWFGDPEGHAEASRRGWESRRDDDDGRSSSRSGRGR